MTPIFLRISFLGDISKEIAASIFVAEVYFNSEDAISTFIRNIGKYLTDYTVYIEEDSKLHTVTCRGCA
jgi:hypothetical protein